MAPGAEPSFGSAEAVIGVVVATMTISHRALNLPTLLQVLARIGYAAIRL